MRSGLVRGDLSGCGHPTVLQVSSFDSKMQLSVGDLHQVKFVNSGILCEDFGLESTMTVAPLNAESLSWALYE
jgi:hypothetical protein